MSLRVLLVLVVLACAPVAAARELSVTIEAPALPLALPIASPSVVATVNDPSEGGLPQARAYVADAPAGTLPAIDIAPPPILRADFTPEALAAALAATEPAPAEPARAPEPPAPLTRAYVGHDAQAATPPVAPEAVVAAIATVAVMGAAAPSLLGWERLRRIGAFALLYTRIARERLLDHGARDRLLAAVRARPGIMLADAAREAAMPRNTAVYHLRRLEKERVVSSVRQGRTRLYFAPGALDQLPNADALAALRHPTTRDIAAHVGASPGLDQQALCQRFGLGPSLAHWHAARLVEAGVVRKEREGRRVRYYPGPQFGLVGSA